MLLRNSVNGLGDLSNLVSLAAVNKTRASSLKTGLEGLNGLQSAELGEGRSLLDVLAGDLTGGGLLEGIDDVLAGSANLVGSTGKSNGEETSVGVRDVLGGDVELGEALSGLGKERETGGVFNGGLAAEKSSKNGGLGLVASGTESAGSRESNSDSVAGLGWDSLLTTEVLGSHGRLDLVLASGTTGGETGEELAYPLGDVGRVGTSGNEGDIRLGVSVLGELSQGVAGEVLLEGSGLAGGDGGTQTAVEGNAVGSINRNGFGVRVDGLLLVLEELADKLAQFVV